jgi:hypothetical protein
MAAWDRRYFNHLEPLLERYLNCGIKKGDAESIGILLVPPILFDCATSPLDLQK